MSGCWISKAVIVAVALAAAMGGVAASGQELTREDLQTAFAEPVALAVKVDKAPVLDGKMDDEAWGAGDWLEFSWADPTVPGYPTSWTKVKTVCDAEALYVLFHCRQIGDMKTVGTGEYSDKVPEDDHVSILLAASPNRWHTRKGGSPWLLIKINPNGAKWLRMYSGSEEDCDGRPLEKLEGLEAKVGRYEGYWVVETKIPFASLFEDVAKMPAFWRANFFRMRTDKRYANIRPGYHGYSHWYTAWRQSGCIPYFQPHPSLFGRLFVPVGTDVPENIRAIKPGAGAEAAARRREAEASARAATLPGLPVRAGELEPLLGGCVAGVRHVPKGPEIRGDLKDPLWKSAAPAVLRYLDLQMPSTEVEKNRTFVYLLADDECLYIGVDCEEQFIKEISVDSGALWTDDVVDVFLDPGRTADYRYIHIEFNSRGKMTRRYMKNDLSWDPKGLVLKTAVGDDRWTAELKIPFEDMGIEKGKRPILWGANFGRSRWARRPAMDETPGWMNWDTMWQPNPIGSPHTPEWFGNLIFEKADLVQEKLATFLSSKGMDLAAAGLKVWKPEPPKPRSADVEDGYGPPVEPAFAKGPVAVRQGDRIRITFAVKEYCDAAVWIEDEAGRMVRHLDAGALGPNAPPQFVPDSLEQTLVWDGKDDDGNQVDVSKCRVKVGLGLRGKFDRIIGWKPGIGGIRGIVAGNDGALCVMTGEVSVDHGWGGCWIRAFDSGGRYLRQIYPFPPNLPLSKLAGARPIPLPDGSWLPVIYQGLNHSLLPQTPGIPDQQPAMTRDGHIIMSNMTFRGMGHGRRLLKIGADGSIPADFLGPQISRYQLDGDFYIALSPDDKYVYVTGLKGRYMWDGGDFHHAVYRVKWDDPDLTELFRKPFIGDPTKAGRDERSLNRPLGLAVDAEGNIFVADSGNGRIAVFRPDGSPLRQISIPDPRNVAVNRKTGAIYAVGKPDGGKGYALVKFKSPADTSPAARVGLQGGSSNFALAVVPDADPPIVWVANGDKVLDKGDSLEIAGNLHKMHSGPYSDVSCGFEGHLMTVNPKTEEIIVGKWHVFDGKTGKFLRHIRLENADGWGGEIAIGKDGNFYVRSGGGSNALWKYSPDGKRLPFKEGVMEVPKLYGGHGNSNRGHCVGPDGDIYFVHHYIPHGNTETTLSRIAPDGTIKKLEFVENHLVSGSGVQVDRRGCIYMGLAVKPFGEPYPKWFEGRLPSSGAAPEPWFFYRQMYGSIVKFKPEGGRLVSDPEGPYMATNYSHFHRCRIEGAVWVRYGYSQMHQKDIESSRCNCQSARFGMDGFDRLYIPDSMRASVDIADSNGNRIIRLGRYGNMDSRGPGSPVPKPELPMSWPLVVCATDTACYVADQVNGWVLKIALHYAVEKECAIR